MFQLGDIIESKTDRVRIEAIDPKGWLRVRSLWSKQRGLISPTGQNRWRLAEIQYSEPRSVLECDAAFARSRLNRYFEQHPNTTISGRTSCPRWWRFPVQQPGSKSSTLEQGIALHSNLEKQLKDLSIRETIKHWSFSKPGCATSEFHDALQTAIANEDADESPERKTKREERAYAIGHADGLMAGEKQVNEMDRADLSKQAEDIRELRAMKIGFEYNLKEQTRIIEDYRIECFNKNKKINSLIYQIKDFEQNNQNHAKELQQASTHIAYLKTCNVRQAELISKLRAELADSDKERQELRVQVTGLKMRNSRQAETIKGAVEKYRDLSTELKNQKITVFKDGDRVIEKDDHPFPEPRSGKVVHVMYSGITQQLKVEWDDGHWSWISALYVKLEAASALQHKVGEQFKVGDQVRRAGGGGVIGIIVEIENSGRSHNIGVRWGEDVCMSWKNVSDLEHA